MSDVTLPEPLDNWRIAQKSALRAINPEVAEGLHVCFTKGSVVQAGFQALRSLSEIDRMIVWEIAFPGIASEVELAWHHLDPQVIIRRDGGDSGYGTRFSFSPSPGESELALITWLRKLLVLTGPYPGAKLDALAANLRHFDADRYDSASGHMIDCDAPAYLASVVLTRQPESELSTRLAEFFEDQWLGRRAGESDRAIATAIFCARRPDLWQRFHGHFAGAGKEPAFLERISVVPIGAQPGAVLSHLKSIRGHDLLRFEAVADRIRGCFGIRWQWKSHRRDDLSPWFADWVSRLESAPGGSGPLPEAPGDCLLALWAEALFDGDSALARIEDPSVLGEGARIAAAHFLGLCPPAQRRNVVCRYAIDPDLRVANLASDLLFGIGQRLPDAEERAALFLKFRDYLKSLPANPELKPSPSPLPSPKLDLSGIQRAVATWFPDGSEGDIEELLPLLDSDARGLVVERLNRYGLTAFDRKLEEVMYGANPEEWHRWLEDHEGSQNMAQRRLLLMLLDDRKIEVAEKAEKAVRGFHLTEEEFLLVQPVFKSKSEAKRLLVTRLLARQSAELLRKIVPGLLSSKTAGERAAAAEILRQLAAQKVTAGLAAELLGSAGDQPGTAVEARSSGASRATPQASREEDPPGFDNAFGLVDPRSLAKPVPPREHDVIVHSPVTLRLIEALDGWVHERAEVMIPSPRAPFHDEWVRLGDGQLPNTYVQTGESREDVVARFPLAEELAGWWRQRPAELRDPDGFEGVRLKFAVEKLLGSTAPQMDTMRRFLFGCDKAPATRSGRPTFERLIAWIEFMNPGCFQPEGVVDYLIDSSETLFVRLPDGQKNRAITWADRLSNVTQGNSQAPRASLERLWSLLRNRRADSQIFFHPQIWDLIALLRQGIASEDEFMWFLVGPRPFGDHDRERAFGELGMASAPPGTYGSRIDFDAGQKAVQKVVDRIIELEVTRGEEPQPWSYAALRIGVVHGARHLQRLLSTLGKTPLRRSAPSRPGKPNLTRSAVLIHLIQASRPAADDCPDSFARLMREAGIPSERLLELALMRPAWTPFIACATGIDGLRDAVGWIYAHTRSTDYQWESKARELWTGELGFDSPLSAEELLEGAVDAEWFKRAYESVGAEVWATLYGAAKFASTHNGHARAKLFADALLGKIGIDQLTEQVSGKGDLNAARAIGLPPLPDACKPRREELLRRYGVLQKLRVTARESKAQRGASEISAFETGVRNLARRAGYEDTVRFEWAMECEAVADLSDATLQVVIDDLKCSVAIQPDGSLAMEVSRGGELLGSVPAAMKKQDGFKRLKQRMDEFKEQASRLRPALESLMLRAVALPAVEWRKILSHPLAGPLVNRLLLADRTGVLGFPSEPDLLGPDGSTREWPADDTELHLVHPVELLTAETWHAWQRAVFDRRIVQPFKQVFREVYLPTSGESNAAQATFTRFAGHAVKARQALAILGQRGWILHPDTGLYRMFRSDGLCAWLTTEEGFGGFAQREELTIRELHFTRIGRGAPAASPAEIPERVFSEAMRDLDLIVSVAHASGSAPEPGRSTLEIRADLIRETCRMLGIEGVDVDHRHARIAGKLGTYLVHLGSGIVHREPGGMLAMKSDSQTERGRIFLPFADDDPQGMEVLSRVLILADDTAIRDPALARALRNQEG